MGAYLLGRNCWVGAPHNHATLPALRAPGNATKSSGMRERTKPKMWVAYKLAKVGKRWARVRRDGEGSAGRSL
jgi:hypothetical protein